MNAIDKILEFLKRKDLPLDVRHVLEEVLRSFRCVWNDDTCKWECCFLQ